MQQVQLAVAKDMHELMIGIAAFIKTTKGFLKDGFQLSDMPALITAILALTPSLTRLDGLGKESQHEQPEFILSALVGALEIYKAVTDNK